MRATCRHGVNPNPRFTCRRDSRSRASQSGPSGPCRTEPFRNSRACGRTRPQWRGQFRLSCSTRPRRAPRSSGEGRAHPLGYANCFRIRMNRPELFTCSFLLFPSRRQRGFSLIEVMVAMVILAFGLMGIMGTFHWADLGLRQGIHGTRALAMAESRLEAKRAVPWELLLTDDIDADGIPEMTMRDDGTHGDTQAGDGMYTGRQDHEGIHLVWTVQPDRFGPLQTVGSAVIQARASYSVGRGQRREIRIGTIRANPNYIGWR